MNNVENYITQKLVEDIDSLLGEPDPDAPDQRCIPSEYGGYVNAMSQNIGQSGTIAALAFLHDSDSENNFRKGSTWPRKPVVNLLENMLKRKGVLSDVDSNPDLLFRYALSIFSDRFQLRRLENEITDAALAIKFTLRTFNLKKIKN